MVILHPPRSAPQPKIVLRPTTVMFFQEEQRERTRSAKVCLVCLIKGQSEFNKQQFMRLLFCSEFLKV